MCKTILNTELTSMARNLESLMFMHSSLLGDLWEQPTMGGATRLVSLSGIQKNCTYMIIIIENFYRAK